MFDYINQTSSQLNDLTGENMSTILSGKIVFEDNPSTEQEQVMRAMKMRKCDICHSWVTTQDIVSNASVYNADEGLRYCATCFAIKQVRDEYLPKKIRLASYHDCRRTDSVINADGENYTLDDVKGIGVEIEIYNGRYVSEIKSTPEFYKIAGAHSRKRMFHCEQDGSVSAEIISNVFTEKSLRDFDWKIITDVMILNGDIKNNVKAGLHIHFSKTWLGDDEKEQAYNYLKLQYFLKSYEDDVFKMSGRQSRSVLGYCNFYSLSMIEEMKRNIVENQRYFNYMPSSHTYALINSRKTIELRIGASTQDPERLKQYILFWVGVVKNIKNVPFDKLYCLKRVFKQVDAETLNYWRNKGLFMKTNANEVRGVSI